MGTGQSVFTKFKKECNYTILLLGQTGSGKTSLLNLIANAHGILQVKFDGDLALSTEELRAFGQGRVTDLSVENALEDRMASKTSDARVYQIELAGNWFFTIIDTPGFGDSRGLDVDKEHVKRIMACLKEKIQSINCVMVVVNGREARMTATMKYVLSQLTAVMPRAVMDHIAVVFSNTASKRKLNFDIKSFEDVGLRVPKYECLDNPFGMVQAATAVPEPVPEDERKELTEDIRKSFKALEQVGWMVHDLMPIPSIKFAELNARRETIEALLANNLELIVDHERLVADLRRHREQIASSGILAPLTRTVVHWKSTVRFSVGPGMFVMPRTATATVRPQKCLALSPACGASATRRLHARIVATGMQHTEYLVTVGEAQKPPSMWMWGTLWTRQKSGCSSKLQMPRGKSMLLLSSWTLLLRNMKSWGFAMHTCTCCVARRQLWKSA